MLRIVFVGCVNFSRITLKRIIGLEGNVVGIITKDRSDFNADFDNLMDLAIAHNIPGLYVTDINSPDSIAGITSMRPDIIFCFGWSSLIKSELLHVAKFGIIGYHPAELPYNRGRHPIIWALVLGLKRTASTFFKMDTGADSGDILNQSFVTIHSDDNASTLYTKLSQSAEHQIAEFLPALNQGSIVLKPQDHSKTNYWRKRNPKDGIIDFRMSAVAIHNLVRGLSYPYVGAEFVTSNNIYKVWESKVVIDDKYKNIEPGKILMRENNELLVKCGSDLIHLPNIDFTENLEYI